MRTDALCCVILVLRILLVSPTYFECLIVRRKNILNLLIINPHSQRLPVLLLLPRGPDFTGHRHGLPLTWHRGVGGPTDHAGARRRRRVEEGRVQLWLVPGLNHRRGGHLGLEHRSRLARRNIGRLNVLVGLLRSKAKRARYLPFACRTPYNRLDIPPCWDSSNVSC